MAREQAQIGDGLRARVRVEGVVRDGVDLAGGDGGIHRGQVVEGDERVSSLWVDMREGGAQRAL